MITSKKVLSYAGFGILILVGCTYNLTQPRVAGDDARFEALRGARIDQGGFSVTSGAGIGSTISAQQQALSKDLVGSGAYLIATGRQLRVIMPETMLFEAESVKIMPQARLILEHMAQTLRQYPDSLIRVVVHSDNRGPEVLMQRLSQNRAQAVAQALADYDLGTGRVSTVGRGAGEPMASNAQAFGRSQNRRVEVIITPTN